VRFWSVAAEERGGRGQQECRRAERRVGADEVGDEAKRAIGPTT
jgi:hypothetical protein